MQLAAHRKFDSRYNARKREALAYFGIESAAALLVALAINLCVLSVFARGFFGADQPAKIGLENAGEYLGETFGPVMRVIWAVGLLAAGVRRTLAPTASVHLRHMGDAMCLRLRTCLGWRWMCVIWAIGLLAAGVDSQCAIPNVRP